MKPRRSLPWMALPALLTGALAVPAQQPASLDQATPMIRVTTRLVVLDVLVTDKTGSPVRDLKAEDFVLEDSGKQQKISLFSLEQPGAAAPLPALPPNIYSNRPQFNLPPGALTVLLIDGLNSPFADQARVRQELIKYAGTQLKPGQQTAVYALGNRLYKLQSFTNDPATLKAAIEAYRPVSLPQHESTLAPARGSSALATGAGSTRPGALIGASELQVNSLLAFQAEQAIPALQTRIDTTLAAMRAIARELSGRPGRKNLVWVSAGFPVSLTPETNEITIVNTRAADPTAPPPLPNETTYGAYNQGIRQQSVEDVRRTAALLADSQVAIYPVDARGLIGSGLADASGSGTDAAGLVMLAGDVGQTLSAAAARREGAQSAMKDLAQETGGRVFINQNDVGHSVDVASSDGGTYYSLGYYPDKKKFDGSFHKLKVSLDRPGLQTRYRRGYFAIDPASIDKKEREAALGASMRGDAQSSLVLFDARVVPPPPAPQMKVPVQFLVPAGSFSAEPTQDGGRQLNLDFFAVAYTPEGKVAASTGQTVNTAVTAQQYAQVRDQGLLLPMELTLPPGQYQVRLAVRDNRTGYFGTLNIPLNLGAASSAP